MNNCNLCEIRRNQNPIYEDIKPCDVMWVGLSAVKIDNSGRTPLNPNTRSGSLIKEIEDRLQGFTFFHTNLVKCFPSDDGMKIRYPNIQEMKNCKTNLKTEIELVKPKIIFALGNIVHDFMKKSGFKNIVKLQHPSYILIYRIKYKLDYIDNIVNTILNKIGDMK